MRLPDRETLARAVGQALATLPHDDPQMIADAILSLLGKSTADSAMTRAVDEAFKAMPTHWDPQMFGESILSILHQAGWTMARTRP